MAASRSGSGIDTVVTRLVTVVRRLSRLGGWRSVRERHDVVFYAPFVGDILASRTSSPPGGAETQILILSRALANRGVRVAIIAYGDPADFPERLDGVRIVSRPRYAGGRGRLIAKALEPVRIWKALWQARSRTVVYRCASLELGLVGLYTRLARRRLLFSTANVVDFSFDELARKRHQLLLYRLGVRLADAIVVQTEEQIPLCEKTFRRRPCLIKSLAPLLEPTYEEPETFLWAGRLVSYKQPLAYVELARAVPEARFRMVGVPPNDDRERSLAEDVTAAAEQVENLELLPPRSHAELGHLMDHAVASVNTARWEGMPNVLLEAWCRGVPALVLEHDPGGVVGEYGLGGFAAGEAVKFAELARELWRSRHDRSELTQRCRAYVAAHHSPDAVAERWVELLTDQAPRIGPRARAAPDMTYADGAQGSHSEGGRIAAGVDGGDERMRPVRLKL